MKVSLRYLRARETEAPEALISLTSDDLSISTSRIRRSLIKEEPLKERSSFILYYRIIFHM